MTYDYYKELIVEYVNLGRSSERLLGEIGFPAEIEIDEDGLFQAVKVIAAAADGDVSQLLSLSGLKGTYFAQKFMLPYRTLQDWCSKKRTPPEYLPMLIGYIMISEICHEQEN